MAHTQWNSLMQGVIGQECRGDGCMPLRFTPAQMAVYADDPGYHACSQPVPACAWTARPMRRS